MTARRRVVLAMTAALIGCGQAHAAPSSGASCAGVATATVISPLQVVAVAAMDFGTITHAPGSGGTATVSPGSAGAQFSGGASGVCAGSDCATAHAARFAIRGEPQRNYAIELPATVVATGTTPSGTDVPTLTVSGLTLSTASGHGVSGAIPRLDALGSDLFEVGGTITLPADLPAARYRASFAVIVSYI
jgi:hypothetical protein